VNPKKHLSFGSLRNGLSSLFNQLPDNRQEGKVKYSIHDTMMFGFTCMYFQDPSLSQFQGRCKEVKHKENLKIHFDIKDNPESTQMKTIIDNVEGEEFRPIFKDYFSRLQRGKHLEQYQIFDGLYICSIDATQYFHSKNINCPNCLTTEHENGSISYSHKVLQAAIMHPDMCQVIPLMPEEIINTDGSSKQDCETNAAKRLIPKIRKDYPQLGLIIVGDGLFSKQPMIEQVFSERMHYIFVAKPSDHKYMMRWIGKNKDKVNKICITDEEGLIHIYEWINDVPLNGRADSINVNFFQYQLISIDENNKEKVIYQNSWITDLQINNQNVKTLGNVKPLVRAGRCRWKIENECFNTFKNQGYNIKHNYGHGQNNLCFNFFLFTLLAFYFHQIFELTDGLYKDCRQKFGSKMHMWETIRSYIKILLFETWEHLLDFALTPQKYHLSFNPPYNSP